MSENIRQSEIKRECPRQIKTVCQRAINRMRQRAIKRVCSVPLSNSMMLIVDSFTLEREGESKRMRQIKRVSTFIEFDDIDGGLFYIHSLPHGEP